MHTVGTIEWTHPNMHKEIMEKVHNFLFAKLQRNI